ncbi:hypothetical protein [Companilactobacillus musae]|uniref:hypothetical protein n=1 Tax=Companilactobacillus musae TaxID=1903258 RepID=UPI000E64F023|nr:hypothetical protein [Companilactobacillus musae]
MNLSIEDEKETFLRTLKEQYENRVKYIDPSEEQNIFSWKSKKLNFNVILTHTSSDSYTFSLQTIVFFAELSKTNNDELTYIDLFNQTSVFEYDNTFSAENKLKYLIQNHLIKNPTFIQGSLMMTTIANFEIENKDISRLAKHFADTEYKLSTDKLNKNLFSQTPLKIFKSKYFTDKYHFENITNTIDDEQFTSELEDCIKAYELGLWFVCSTGIGSIIEHLLYLTINNFDKKFDSQKNDGRPPISYLGKDPTRVDYFNGLKKCLPRFDDRQKRQLEAMFLLRNSVDHFNSGYSNKGICDILLQGVVDTYNGIYLQSL